MQTAAPWAKGTDHREVKAKLWTYKSIAATLFHRGIAFKQNPGTCIQPLYSQPLHDNVQGYSHLLNFYDLSQPQAWVCHLTDRLGVVHLLDCPLWAPIPTRGRSGNVTQSTGGSQLFCPPRCFPHSPLRLPALLCPFHTPQASDTSA